MMERLQKVLSAAGVASRRTAEELIQQGRVSVNGTTVTTLGTKADPAADEIRVDGRRIKPVQTLRYLLLHKPRGYVTTRNDPQKRKTVMDLLGSVREYVYPVGRLDYDSEGLLLVTNDGELAAALTHPATRSNANIGRWSWGCRTRARSSGSRAGSCSTDVARRRPSSALRRPIAMSPRSRRCSCSPCGRDAIARCGGCARRWGTRSSGSRACASARCATSAFARARCAT